MTNKYKLYKFTFKGEVFCALDPNDDLVKQVGNALTSVYGAADIFEEIINDTGKFTITPASEEDVRKAGWADHAIPYGRLNFPISYYFTKHIIVDGKRYKLVLDEENV